MGRPRHRPPPPGGAVLGDRLMWVMVFIAVVAGLAWVMWPIFSILWRRQLCLPPRPHR